MAGLLAVPDARTCSFGSEIYNSVDAAKCKALGATAGDTSQRLEACSACSHPQAHTAQAFLAPDQHARESLWTGRNHVLTHCHSSAGTSLRCYAVSAKEQPLAPMTLHWHEGSLHPTTAATPATTRRESPPPDVDVGTSITTDSIIDACACCLLGSVFKQNGQTQKTWARGAFGG